AERPRDADQRWSLGLVIISYLNAVLGAPSQQLCLRQMPTSRLWRIDPVVFAEWQNKPGGGNSGVTSDRIVSGHGPTRMPESPHGLRSPTRPPSLPSRKCRENGASLFFWWMNLGRRIACNRS